MLSVLFWWVGLLTKASVAIDGSKFKAVNNVTALRQLERRSFSRAVAALAMTTSRGHTRQGPPVDEVLRSNWGDDDKAALILRAATSPLGTSNFADIQSTPRARLVGEDGRTTEWMSKALRAYQRRTATIDAIIASTGDVALQMRQAVLGCMPLS